MLNEQRRQQLDGIVQKMITNKESDSNIQFVVNDFSQKYASEQEVQPLKTPFIEKVGNFTGVTPLAKGLAQVIYANTPQGKELENKIKNNIATPEELQAYSEIKGQMPMKGQLVGGAAKTALTLGTLGTGSIATNLAGRVAEGGILGASFTALDNIQNKRKVTDNLVAGAVVGGAIPLAGAAIKKGLQVAGGSIQKGGQAIQQSVIRPSKADIEDGFRIDNIKKYNLGGGIRQTLEKTENKIGELTKQLYEKLGSRKDVAIDLNEVATQTAKDLLLNKSKSFGNIGGTKRILQSLASEIEEASNNGLVDLIEAQAIKQAAGKKGAWVFGAVDPDAKATELVYTKFYQKLKQEIEKKAPEGIREINKQIGELIPISHAIIRRIPVTERNNALSLTDIISLGFSTVDPKALSILAVNRLSKSGGFGNLLTQIGSEIKKTPLPKSGVGQRIFGR